MQLREPEALGLLDQHHGRVRHVHAHFDNRGRNQNLHPTAFEFLHGRFFFRCRKTPVQQADRDIGKNLLRKMLVHLLGRFHGLRFRFLDHRIYHVGLPARVDLLF